MDITVSRDRTDAASITVTFDALDHDLAFPCGVHDAEVLYQVKHSCGKSTSEELAVFAAFAKLVETGDPSKTPAGQLDALAKRLKDSRQSLSNEVSGGNG